MRIYHDHTTWDLSESKVLLNWDTSSVRLCITIIIIITVTVVSFPQTERVKPRKGDTSGELACECRDITG
jgi:hypothetical protein